MGKKKAKEKRIKYTCDACKKKRTRIESNVVRYGDEIFCVECIEPGAEEKKLDIAELFKDPPSVPGAKRRGRPPGSKTKSITIETLPECCPVCESTDAEVLNVRRRPIDGVTRGGRKFNSVVWRRKRCLNCPQIRTEKSYEMTRKATG